jgi:hypothetical protein
LRFPSTFVFKTRRMWMKSCEMTKDCETPTRESLQGQGARM